MCACLYEETVACDSRAKVFVKSLRCEILRRLWPPACPNFVSSLPDMKRNNMDILDDMPKVTHVNSISWLTLLLVAIWLPGLFLGLP